MDVFEIDDVLSLYLTEWAKAWVLTTYMSDANRERFIVLCSKFPGVSVTNNSALVARYFLEKYNMFLFPHIIRSMTAKLGSGNWKMMLMDETDTVHSRIPIGFIAGRIKRGENLRIERRENSIEVSV